MTYYLFLIKTEVVMVINFKPLTDEQWALIFSLIDTTFPPEKKRGGAEVTYEKSGIPCCLSSHEGAAGLICHMTQIFLSPALPDITG